MTIKQQGGIFGRNPTFNDTTSTDLTVLNKLGVQNSDPKAAVHIGSNSTFAGTAGYTTLLIADISNGAQLSLRGLSPKLNFDSTGGADCEIKFDNDLIFRDLFTDTERARLHSSGSLALPSGGGIDFSATAGTGTSELFDDYEEGVHTTSITPTTSGTVSMPSTNNQLAYTKVGNLVHVSGYLYVSGVSSPVGAFDISLPFAVADLQDAGGSGAASLWLTNVNTANVADFVGAVDEGDTFLRIRLGAGPNVSNTSAEELKTGSQIKISLTYKAA
jgi:hypothetical protein